MKRKTEMVLTSILSSQERKKKGPAMRGTIKSSRSQDAIASTRDERATRKAAILQSEIRIPQSNK